MVLGGIEIDKNGILGGLELINQSARTLPQDVASAIGVMNSGLLGATYAPIWYIGRQVVNGINHTLVFEQIRSTKNADKGIVIGIINVPPGPEAFTGKDAKVVKIIDEANLEGEAKDAWYKGLDGLVGVAYKPLAYIGHQLVSQSTNYHFIASAQTVYPGAEPRAVRVVINRYKDTFSIVSIENL